MHPSEGARIWHGNHAEIHRLVPKLQSGQGHSCGLQLDATPITPAGGIIAGLVAPDLFLAICTLFNMVLTTIPPDRVRGRA
jgi:hypothetical protein